MSENKKTLILELTSKKAVSDRKKMSSKTISINPIISKKIINYNLIEK